MPLAHALRYDLHSSITVISRPVIYDMKHISDLISLLNHLLIDWFSRRRCFWTIHKLSS